MDAIQWLGLVILISSLVTLIGHSFINAYFRRKEEMMNKLIQTGKGELNA